MRTRTKKRICECLCAAGGIFGLMSCAGLCVWGIITGAVVFGAAGWKAGLFVE